MKRLALFICICWNLIKLCMNINIGYRVLPFHNFHLRGQTKVAYIKICYETSSFICISRSIFWNLTKLCMNVDIGCAVILPFHDFHLRGQINIAMYKYVLKHPFRKDIFKQTYPNVVLRDYILTLAIYAVHTRVQTQVVSNL